MGTWIIHTWQMLAVSFEAWLNTSILEYSSSQDYDLAWLDLIVHNRLGMPEQNNT